MSRLEELIADYCPDGVEYTPLGKVCAIGKGTQFNKSDMNEAGTYPVINGGINPSGYIEKYNQKENTITISQGGASAGYVNWIKVKFWSGAHCYVLTPMNSILNRYLFHFVKSQEYQLQECQYGAGIPALSKSTVSDLEIPVPPLPVQEEIVRILDNFTELTAELTARKKQYEYYHNALTNFVDRNEVKWVSVGDCFEFKNGINKGKEFFGKGSYIVNFTDVYNNRWLSKETLRGRVITEPKESKAYSARKGDIFFTRTSETKEDIGMVSALIEDIDGCVFSGFVLRARPTTNHWIPKFCAYYFSSNIIRDEIVRYASFTTRALTSGPRLSKLKIPLLTIAEQEHIVDILDRFDILCNDISSGLPAEIAARQKQYEYYRDKLLTFKELT